MNRWPVSARKSKLVSPTKEPATTLDINRLPLLRIGMGPGCRDFMADELADNRLVGCVVWLAIFAVVFMGGLGIGKLF